VPEHWAAATMTAMSSRDLLVITVLFALGCGSESPAPDDPAGPGAGLDGPAPALEASDEPTTLEVPAGAPLVAFLGDSLSAGLHLPARATFPAVLQRRLAHGEHPFRLLNAGVSGDTTAGGLRRLDWILKSEPDVLVVELGGNDGLRGQSLELIEDNLERIVTRAREAGASVLLLGMRMPRNYGDYARRFEAIYPRLAERLDVPLVALLEGVGGVPELNLPDGIHPTEQGHVRLADNVEEALEQALAQL